MRVKEPALTMAQVPSLDRFCTEVLSAAGADGPTAEAASRAIMHGTVHGIDSHGVRLLGHYVKTLRNGRINGAPRLSFRRVRSGTGLLDADHAHGALATFAAADHSLEMARESGIAAVGIRNTSHFGPAGAYAVAVAERGMLGFICANSDSFVRLHDGAARFHGTNPIALAVPSGDAHPWLLDMATSAIPYNRVQLYRSIGESLPPSVASDGAGEDTRDPGAVEMLAPLGAGVGFKGAGLAGLAEIFSAVLTGMRLSPEILPMEGPDLATPREMGAFVMVIDPEGFVGAEIVKAGMVRYLAALRASPARPGTQVLAPGDREWAEAQRRRRDGVMLDRVTADCFRQLAAEYGLVPPFDD